MKNRILLPGSDEVFFAEHVSRRARIRKPFHEQEYDAEFRSLGDHDFKRRRVLVVRTRPPNLATGAPMPLMPIPFLTYADEEIADEDAVLMPIIDELMREAAAGYGIKTPRRRK